MTFLGGLLVGSGVTILFMSWLSRPKKIPNFMERHYSEHIKEIKNNLN